MHRARQRQWWPAGELGVHMVHEVKGGRSGMARRPAAHATPACRGSGEACGHDGVVNGRTSRLEKKGRKKMTWAHT